MHRFHFSGRPQPGQRRWRKRAPSPTDSYPDSPYNMTARKRKCDDADEMSVSPHSSPSMASRQLARPAKRVRASHDMTGRPLSLPRLLETLDNTQLRTVLQTICERHPDLGQEVVNGAPRPTASSALNVLGAYLERLRAAVPYGQTSSDYNYYRIRQPLMALTEAISDFTPQFLPPIEQQTNVSLQYLDGATKLIHDLPNWDSQQYRHHKDNAYDELSGAWVAVITEASKRGGGFSLHTSGCYQTLAKHNQQSGGRLGQALSALANLGWTEPAPGGQMNGSTEQGSILDQIMNGSYGASVRVGPW